MIRWNTNCFVWFTVQELNLWFGIGQVIRLLSMKLKLTCLLYDDLFVQCMWHLFKAVYGFPICKTHRVFCFPHCPLGLWKIASHISDTKKRKIKKINMCIMIKLKWMIKSTKSCIYTVLSHNDSARVLVPQLFLTPYSSCVPKPLVTRADFRYSIDALFCPKGKLIFKR